MKSNREKKESQQNVARIRIETLFKQSEIVFSSNPKMADRYVQMAKKISLKYKVPFTKSQKESFCKKCESYLNPAKNSRVRLNNGKIVIKCEKCGNIRRFSYK